MSLSHIPNEMAIMINIIVITITIALFIGTSLYIVKKGETVKETTLTQRHPFVYSIVG